MLDQLNVLVYWKHNTKQAFSKGAKSDSGYLENISYSLEDTTIESLKHFWVHF